VTPFSVPDEEVHVIRSGWLDLSRAIFAIVGGGALAMAVGGLTGGASLTDPVFPAGLALGVLSLGAAAWVRGSAPWQAIVTWLGIGAVLAGVAAFGWFIFTDPDLGVDVYPYFIVPAAILVAASIGMALGRRSVATAVAG
jgi:hypothetical protein